MLQDQEPLSQGVSLPRTCRVHLASGTANPPLGAGPTPPPALVGGHRTPSRPRHQKRPAPLAGGRSAGQTQKSRAAGEFRDEAAARAASAEPWRERSGDQVLAVRPGRWASRLPRPGTAMQGRRGRGAPTTRGERSGARPQRGRLSGRCEKWRPEPRSRRALSPLRTPAARRPAP